MNEIEAAFEKKYAGLDECDCLTAIEFLREMIKAFDWVNESFNMSFTVEELIKIRKAWLVCEWDFYPDQWTERQVQDALNGIIPKWDHNEQPIYTQS